MNITDDVCSLSDNAPICDDDNIGVPASASASDSNYIENSKSYGMNIANQQNYIQTIIEFPTKISDYEMCYMANRQQNFGQANQNKGRNYNQVTVVHDNESNQNSGTDNQSLMVNSFPNNLNSTENTHQSIDNMTNQMLATNITINDQSGDSHRPAECDRGSDPRPRSNTFQYESMPNVESKDCEYLKLVMAFKRTLVLPDVFFSYDTVICYCSFCLPNSARNPFEGDYFKHFFFHGVFRKRWIRMTTEIVLNFDNLSEIRLGSIQIESHGHKC